MSYRMNSVLAVALIVMTAAVMNVMNVTNTVEASEQWSPDHELRYEEFYERELRECAASLEDPFDGCVRAYPCLEICDESDWVAPRPVSSYCSENYIAAICGDGSNDETGDMVSLEGHYDPNEEWPDMTSCPEGYKLVGSEDEGHSCLIIHENDDDLEREENNASSSEENNSLLSEVENEPDPADDRASAVDDRNEHDNETALASAVSFEGAFEYEHEIVDFGGNLCLLVLGSPR